MIPPTNTAGLRNVASALPLLALSEQELVISDGLCPRIGALVEGMATEQVAIATTSEPLQAITAALEAHRGSGGTLATLHLVAHGRPGAFRLAGKWVDTAALLAGAPLLARWQVRRIALWSCHVGQDPGFLAVLAELSGAEIWSSAASLDNRTGWSLSPIRRIGRGNHPDGADVVAPFAVRQRDAWTYSLATAYFEELFISNDDEHNFNTTSITLVDPQPSYTNIQSEGSGGGQGNNVNGTLTVNNTGTQTLTDVTVTDPKVSPITPVAGASDFDGDVDIAVEITGAIDVFQEFFLSLDVSGSISSSDYDLYRSGYVNAFNNPTIKSQIQSTYSQGGIAIAVGQWDSTAYSPPVIGWTQINNDTAYTQFVNALAIMPRQGSGGTIVGIGMRAAIDQILNNNFTAPGANTRIIDVSTDGATLNVPLAEQQRSRAEANDIIINGLGIGLDTTDTLTNSVVTRATTTTKAGFVLTAANFNDFETAVTSKLLAETGPTENPSLTIDKQLVSISGNPNDTVVNAAGDVIAYTLTVTNTGDVALSNIFVEDPRSKYSITIGGLQPGASQTVNTTYTVTQEDLDTNGNENDGDIDNTATATSFLSLEPLVTISDDDSVAVPLVVSPTLELIKDGTFNDENGDGFATPGETITYTFTVTNTGNQTLTDVAVSDEKVSTITPVAGDGDGDLDVDTLAVGDTADFTGSYAITEADITAGKVENAALATGTPPGGGPEVEGPSGEIITELPGGVPSNPSLTITKLAAVPGGTASVGELITYTITVGNSGNQTLTNVVVTDPLATPDTVGTIASLAPGASQDLTFTYTVSQDDIDSNGGGDGDIDNTATADSAQTDPVSASAAVPLAGGGGGGTPQPPKPPQPPLQLVPTENGKGVTVVGPEGQGLWVELTVVGAQAYLQNSLNVLRFSGGSSEAVGALGSAPIVPDSGVLGGKRYVFLESGQELQFTQSPGQLPTVLDPNLTVAGADPEILLNLDDGGAGPDADFNDLVVNIRTVDFTPDPDYVIGLPQVDATAGLLDLTSFGETGLNLNIQTHSELFSTLSFVKVEVDPLSGLSVGGVSASAGESFLEEVRDNLVDFSYTLGGEGASGSVFWDPAEAGFYAPVLISGNGDLLTFGASGGSDGLPHLKVLGQNSFGFEDVLAFQGADWDFNDFLLTAQVA